MSKIILKFFSVLILCLSFSQVQLAQEITGAINGTVRDTQGAAIPAATVTIIDTTKNDLVVRTLVTNQDGEFSVPQLPVSVYRVEVQLAGFKRYVQTDLKLDVNQRREINVALEAGDISASVTVEADPVQVNLSSATSGALITGNQAREAPLNNRNFTQLVLQSPGVSNNNDDLLNVGSVNPATSGANLQSVSINGARSSSNTYTVDGADTTDRGSNLTIQTYPSIDAIGEFRILRSLYPAESGRSGGGQINVITRSGTDQFHGSLYEFVRNEKLNANDFLTNQLTPGQITAAGLRVEDNGKVSRRPFRYNDYGYTIGGPVYFLGFGEGGKTIKRYDRTFFFFSQEFRRDIRFPTFAVTVPTAALRGGTFPIAVCLRYNALGTTCEETLAANTQLPANRRSAAANAYINNIYAPLGEPSNGFGLNTSARNDVKFHQEILRLDHSFSEKLNVFYRFQSDTIPSIDANSLFSSGSGLPGVSVTSTKSPGRTQSARLNYVITPNLIAEVGFAHSYGAIISEPIGKLLRENSPGITIPLAFESAINRIPTISNNGFSNIQGYGPLNNFSNNDDLNGSITWVVGNHTTKFGASRTWFRKNENALAGNNEGIFSFSNILPAGITNNATNQTYQRFANFLVGNAQTFTQARFDYTGDLRSRNVEAYAQDEWRIRPNLTLYAGLRYSLFGQPTDKNGRLSTFDPELFNIANAPQVRGNGDRVAGSGNYCNGLIVNSQNVVNLGDCRPTASPYGEAIGKTNKLNFAPRIGVAFDPFGKGTTSIRTGYGIFHEQTLLGIYLQNIGTNAPYQQNIVLNNTNLDNPLAILNGQPPAATVAAAAAVVRAIDPKLKTPYYQHWSLDLQHQLDSKTLVTIGYFGSRGTNLIGVVDINLLRPGQAAQAQCENIALTATVACQTGVFTSQAQETILDQIRPYRGYRNINIIQSRFNSDYHSLQATVERRFTTGSQINVAYTFAKNLTDNQSDRSTAPQNPYDIRSEYGRAALDRRHVLTANYTYELPFFNQSGNGFVKYVLGGWASSGIFVFNTGIPFTAATSNFDPSGIGFLGSSAAGGRPNQICDPNQGGASNQQQFFNTACFQTNAATGTAVSGAGTAGRGTINGPNTYRVDLSLLKNFNFTETMRLQLRAEGFNVFNTTSYRTLVTNVTSTQYGQVTGFRDPRSIQFGIKFSF